jgi:hypothetical protein
MYNIKGFKDYVSLINEAVIMPIDYTELIKELTEACGTRPISVEQANMIGNEHGVIFKTYNEFYEALPDHLKHTAPPRGTPIFGLVDSNNEVNIVVGIPAIGYRELGFISHVIQHESIHKGQWERRGENVEYTLPDANDRGSYFSNKDEIMAFSQSIIEMMMSMGGLRNMSQLGDLLGKNRLYLDIKRNVSEDVLKKYNKYIYQYAEQYLNN